jgi:DNA-binding transcriptional MerR regulator
MASDWTLDDLVARVGDALGAVDYRGAPNGRVRDVPDRRAVRWYTTIGLLDRPAAMRGRTALYGRRHLAQLVAIKRRQAEGRSLTEIQAELVGATDDRLAEIAGLPMSAAGPRTVDGSGADRSTVDTDTDNGTVTVRPRAAFWTSVPASPAPVPPPVPPVPVASAMASADSAPDGVLTGVPLGHGAVLLLPSTPAPDDLAALRDAARPLIDLLIARGLVPEDRSAP